MTRNQSVGAFFVAVILGLVMLGKALGLAIIAAMVITCGWFGNRE